MKTPGKDKRDGAYRLKDSAAHRSYYDGWAADYDEGFARSVGYVYPERIARRFLELAGPDDDPVADIGCGTGLAGVALKGSGLTVDGLDISKGMLAEASRKDAYRHLFAADLTKPSTLPEERYGGLISCGTFTLGHLGPDALNACLTIARPGALFVIGVNSKHWQDAGFGQLFDRLSVAGAISSPDISTAAIYADSEDPAAPENVASLVAFRTVWES